MTVTLTFTLLPLLNTSLRVSSLPRVRNCGHHEKNVIKDY